MRNLEVSRRTLLQGLGAVGVASLAPAMLRAQGAGAQLTVHANEVAATMPENYTGLSYESAQMVHPGFFSKGNRDLVGLVKTLGSRGGVLRIGGNTSAFTTWQPGGADSATAKTGDAGGYGPDLGSKVEKQHPGMYVLTPGAIDNLRGFLDATGWDLIYGLNLRHGTPETAADEAAYVTKTCGTKLLALQFGNEPDLFKHDDGSNWTFAEFLNKWQAMYKAVHARVPQVPIAGPDCAFNAAWVEQFAQATKGDVKLLTTHYYAEGPPTDPKMTLDFLLHPGEKLKADVYDAMDAAKKAGLPFRMSEGNSCYNGGKPGVSNTLGSALWAGDFMLDLAARGAKGVNLHGGGEGVYTPIATDKQGVCSARPDFYGMWLAGEFAGAKLLKTDLSGMPSDANLTAYAGKSGRGMFVAVFNKGNAPVTLAVKGMTGKAELFKLSGPSLTATSGVQFGEGARTAGTEWQLKPNGSTSLSPVEVAAGSAVLLRTS